MFTRGIDPKIEGEKLGELLGVPEDGDMPPSIEKRVGNWSDRFEEYIEPHLIYEVREILGIDGDSIRLRGGQVIHSRRIARTLEGCDLLVAFIATLGGEISGRIDELTGENHLSDAYIVDSMGSVAVEDMVERFHLNAENMYKAASRSVTMRFSPGYCDWNIKEQRTIFSLFAPDRVGVELTDTFLMRPRKSISGVFGVKPYYEGRSVDSYIPCVDCAKKKCDSRRADFVKEETQK